MEEQNILLLLKEIGPIGATIIILVYMYLQHKKEKVSVKKAKNSKLEDIKFRDEVRTHFVEDENIHQEITNFLKVSNEKYIEEVNESQIQIITTAIINCSKHAISDYTLKIIQENHISENEREVKAKLKNFIINRFHKDFLSFKEFSFKEKTLSESMDAAWKKHAISTITEMVINQKGHKAVQSAMDNIFESFRYEMLDSILS